MIQTKAKQMTSAEYRFFNGMLQAGWRIEELEGALTELLAAGDELLAVEREVHPPMSDYQRAVYRYGEAERVAKRLLAEKQYLVDQ